MEKIKTLKCIRCGKEHSVAEGKYTCSACGGNLQVIYDYDNIRQHLTRESLKSCNDRSIWRYQDILPVRDLESVPPVQVGWTPLYNATKMASQLGIRNVYVKDDGRNPSASFKDRAGAVVVAHARETGETVITTASTGNAASSLSCLTGSIGMKTVIFVPKTAPAPKIAQLLVFGAEVIMVDGTYDDAFDLCLKASKEYGWYNRSTGINPYTREGKKTCAFEICEQLDWNVPDKVCVSVGDGNIISGLWKGFTDFYKLGLIDRLPQLVAVQAEHSNAVKLAVDKGTDEITAVSGNTVADSISVSVPRDGVAAARAVLESKGFAISVSDSEILAGIPKVARGVGVFAEPAAAAAYVGLEKAVGEGKIRPEDRVAVVITGNGLKDVNSAMKSVGKPYLVKPDLEELKKLVKDQKIA